MKKLAAALALALLLSACTSVVPASPTPQLAGTSWQLTELVSGSETTPALASAPVTVRFDDGSLAGKACNSFRATYTLSGDTITIGQAAATRMACTEAGVMEQEDAILGLLPALTRVGLDGDVLTLSDADGRGLRFGKA